MQPHRSETHSPVPPSLPLFRCAHLPTPFRPSSQANGLVPIVEPEVTLGEGSYRQGGEGGVECE